MHTNGQACIHHTQKVSYRSFCFGVGVGGEDYQGSVHGDLSGGFSSSKNEPEFL